MPNRSPELPRDCIEELQSIAIRIPPSSKYIPESQGLSELQGVSLQAELLTLNPAS